MVQTVTTNAWGRRILSAFWGALFGLICLFGAVFLMFWNEGNGLHTAQSLKQTLKVLIAVPNAPVDEKNDMKVVYTSGMATTNDILKDTVFGVSEKAIQLDRQVEMYQWEQEVETTTQKQLGGSEQEVKTYTYKQVWSDDLIDSRDFKEQTGHENPTRMPVESDMQYANHVKVGDFSLHESLISQISGSTAIDLNKADVMALKAKFNKPVKQDGDKLYIGDDPDKPKIGDMRVTLSVVLPAMVSVIGQQSGHSLQAYMAPAGRSVSLIEMGQVSPEEMVHDAEMQNNVITWLLRLAALVLMIVGFGLIMKPIDVLADVVPFFGNLVGLGTGLIAFTLGFCLWLVSFAIAWFAVRPLLAGGLLLLVAVIIYMLVQHKKRK